MGDNDPAKQEKLSESVNHLNLQDPPNQRDSPFLSPTDKDKPNSSTTPFHVLVWAVSSQDTEATTTNPVRAESTRTEQRTNQNLLTQYLQEMDQYLRDHTNLKEGLAYKNCRPCEYSEVRKIISKQEESVFKSADLDPQKRKAYENRAEIFNQVTIVFQLFLPLSYAGPTCDVFWGAVKRLLHVS